MTGSRLSRWICVFLIITKDILPLLQSTVAKDHRIYIYSTYIVIKFYLFDYRQIIKENGIPGLEERSRVPPQWVRDTGRSLGRDRKHHAQLTGPKPHGRALPRQRTSCGGEQLPPCPRQAHLWACGGRRRGCCAHTPSASTFALAQCRGQLGSGKLLPVPREVGRGSIKSGVPYLLAISWNILSFFGVPWSFWKFFGIFLKILVKLGMLARCIG